MRVRVREREGGREGEVLSSEPSLIGDHLQDPRRQPAAQALESNFTFPSISGGDSHRNRPRSSTWPYSRVNHGTATSSAAHSSDWPDR